MTRSLVAGGIVGMVEMRWGDCGILLGGSAVEAECRRLTQGAFMTRKGHSILGWVRVERE